MRSSRAQQDLHRNLRSAAKKPADLRISHSWFDPIGDRVALLRFQVFEQSRASPADFVRPASALRESIYRAKDLSDSQGLGCIPTPALNGPFQFFPTPVHSSIPLHPTLCRQISERSGLAESASAPL